MSSVRYIARPRSKVAYWTADKDGRRMIKEWFLDTFEGESLPFYASFINWCCAEVDKFKNPRAKYANEAREEQARKVWQVLRQQPLDVREFIGLMKVYYNGSFQSGLRGGHIYKPRKANGREIMQGDKKLRQIVWTEGERVAMMAASGEEEAGSRRMQRKVDEARLQLKLDAEEREAQIELARQEAELAEKEREETQAQWQPFNEAVAGLSEEIDFEDTAAGIDGIEISKKQAWAEKLVYRIKE